MTSARAGAPSRVARVTPVYPRRRSRGCRGGLSCSRPENLQRTGAFKIRGLQHDRPAVGGRARTGVLTASAGNHGQAVAWAARQADLGDDLPFPRALDGEGRRCARYGAQVELAGGDSTRRSRSHQARSEETGSTFVHAFDDVRVVAGRGRSGSSSRDSCPPARDGRDPGRRRRLARTRDRTRCPASRGQARRRPVGRVRAVRRPRPRGATIADGIAVRSRGRSRASSTTCSTTSSWSTTTRSRRRSILLLERSKLVVEGAGAARGGDLANRAGGKGRCAPSSRAATSTRRR